MSQTEIKELENQILDLKKKVAELKRAQPPIPVKNYTFDGVNGEVKLSDLFQGKSDLVLISNMGKMCSHCTLWADGFNGVAPELESRAGFVLISADPIEVAQKFAASRKWRFQIASDSRTEFRKDMGFVGSDGGPWPGIIGYRKLEDGSIQRIASAELGEGDNFCPIYHMFDLLADGWEDWNPRYRL